MGVPCSCPLGFHCDLENAFESFLAKSIDLENDNNHNSSLQSIPSNENDSQDQTFKLIARKARKMWTPDSPVFEHEAAVKLQKVYKSFRTRRKLADCAVLVEQSWWKLLDFAELKHSSISFFDLDKHETAMSRWSRARTRAAKVGKGLSKNGKAQKLALQHWLEAIDPRHRYGHNLHFYYVNWLNSQSKEPFFYWLDIGEGREVNLVEKCPRWKLQLQCIKYLGPMERKAYEVGVEDGKLFYKQTGEFLNTTKEPKGSKWIFVLSTSKTLYVGKKKKGSFQHSSFLAGGATMAAGRIVAENGVLKAVWPHSGHYRPTPENFQDFISFLQENNVDLADVKLDSTDDETEEESVKKKGGVHLRSNSSEDESAEKDRSETEVNENKSVSDYNSRKEEPHCGFAQTLTALKIPSKDNFLQKLMKENEEITNSPLASPIKGYDESKEETIPEESISQRINSHKEMKSYQLGKHLSCKWSTGAGPRIGCVRDYPSELQNHALEQVNLSPRSKLLSRLKFPSRVSTPYSNLCRSSDRRYSTHVKLLTASSF